MILVDANLLIYASVKDFDEHPRARAWLDGRLNGTTRVGLPWESLTTYVRIVTNPRVFRRPMRAADAMSQVRQWRNRPVSWTPGPTERHEEVFAELLASGGAQADLVPDAHLGAIAIQHGLTLMSADRDFARFPGLSWENPLA